MFKSSEQESKEFPARYYVVREVIERMQSVPSVFSGTFHQLGDLGLFCAPLYHIPPSLPKIMGIMVKEDI